MVKPDWPLKRSLNSYPMWKLRRFLSSKVLPVRAKNLVYAEVLRRRYLRNS